MEACSDLELFVDMNPSEVAKREKILRDDKGALGRLAPNSAGEGFYLEISPALQFRGSWPRAGVWFGRKKFAWQEVNELNAATVRDSATYFSLFC
jgi:hypothetical protein